MKGKFVIGIDFGTESGRAVLVRVSDGAEIATAVKQYASSVIDTQLPGSDVRLPPDWALQDADDWLSVLREAVPEVIRTAGADPADVAGIGIDFTSCTMLPVLADGTPLSALDEFRAVPHAWPKLWKHHAAQPQADRINAVAEQRGEEWLKYYGGKISSEWFFPKALQILEEAPEVYAAAARLIEAADWIVWQLTGVESRNECTAGYKAMFHNGDFPSSEYFAAVNPDFADVVAAKMSRELQPLGGSAGGLSAAAAAWTGLPQGVPVAVANVDAHVTLPATGSVEAGTMVMIMGTSTCDVLTGDELSVVEGMCGVVPGGIVPGAFGYEAGQSAVGDIFAWYLDHAVPASIRDQAERDGISVHDLLEQQAAAQLPGEHGLVALDWLGGNRSVLVDADVSGLIIGLTLASRPADIYRALLEATAFGKRVIIDSFEKNGVPVRKLVAAGGLPQKNQLLMQIYADVLDREIFVIRSSQGPALGSAMHAAVAAGLYPDIAAAAAAMGGLSEVSWRPDPARVAVYAELYAEYLYLHDLFGRSGDTDEAGVMKRLRRLRNRVLTGKEEVSA